MRPRIRRWLGPPRHLLLALAAVTVASASSLSWVGWEMLRQDKAVEAQREQERLEHQADLAVQALERVLAATEERLADWVSRPFDTVPEPVHSGHIVTFTETAIRSNPSPLLFYPYLPHPAEPPQQLFADGEAAEFQQHDHRRAAQLFRRLAQSPDRIVRAAALMRLGRVLRASKQHAEALAAYTELAALGDVALVGLPGELVARSARIQVLTELGQHQTARAEATELGEQLARGRWKLTSGQYEYYLDVAAAGAGGPPEIGTEKFATARAAADLWLAWKGGMPPTGRRSMHAGGMALLAAWRSGADRIALWIVPADELLRTLPTDPQTAIALSDPAGSAVAGVLDGPGRTAVRPPTDTRLPWTVHARPATNVASRSGLTRGRLIVLGLAMMVTFLLAGFSFIGRAIKQEMDLARLQSDFVSAVSHEFRTPLAAMRQLSELLAAGRVPDRARQQQYYESLAGESRRLQRLVENLLDFGRLQAGAPPFRRESLDLRTLVEQVVSEFRARLSRPDCRIDVSGDDAPVRLLADADAIALALHNVLDNAVKYGGAGGGVWISWAREGSRVALRVRDEGPGIAAHERTRIFERFVRGTAAAAGNVRGTGIGLAMVQQVVISHGGEVRVDSAPGTGSVFTISLPMTEQTG